MADPQNQTDPPTAPPNTASAAFLRASIPLPRDAEFRADVEYAIVRDKLVESGMPADGEGPIDWTVVDSEDGTTHTLTGVWPAGGA